MGVGGGRGGRGGVRGTVVVAQPYRGQTRAIVVPTIISPSYSPSPSFSPSPYPMMVGGGRGGRGGRGGYRGGAIGGGIEGEGGLE